MTTRWGILGCGDVCEVKSGPGFQKARGSELVAVMRRDALKAADFARRHNVPRWYDDAEALVNDPEVDAVYVASPPSSHLELALKVAKAKKPCLVEKPMARNAEECKRMMDAFAHAGVPLFVAYYRRALPVFIRARQLVDRGEIGLVTSATIRFSRPHNPNAGWRVDPQISGGGLFLDLASHALNALEWILGDFEDAQGQASSIMTNNVVEDLVTLQWRAPRRQDERRIDALGTAIYNFASAVSEDVLEITGTAGRLSWACFGDGTLAITRADGRVEVERHPPPAHVHQPLIQTIVDELHGKGKCPSNALSGMRTNAIMDEALRSFRAGR